MFGRKQVQPSTQCSAPQPRPSGQGVTNQGGDADAAIAALSQAIGLDLDFEMAYIFAPSLWRIPGVGAMLTDVGLAHNMRGNTLQLLKNPQTVATLAERAHDDPLRAVLEKSRIGVALYNPDAENGYSDGLIGMQAKILAGIFTDCPGDRARHYAVFDLHKFSTDVMLGKVKLG